MTTTAASSDKPKRLMTRNVLVPGLATLLFAAIYVAMFHTVERNSVFWVILVSVMNSAPCFAVGNASRPWRHSDDERLRWRATAVLLAVGLLITLPALGAWYGISRGAMPIFYPVIAIGSAPVAVGIFFLIADGLALLTRRAKSIQTRMMLMGALCVGLSSVFPYWIRFDHRTALGLLIYAAIGAVIIIGFSGVITERIIAPLKRTAAAMNEVTAGNLNVALDDTGRDELASVAHAFNAMTHGLREREFLERAFGRYVAPSVLAALKQTRALEMKPERRDASVLFADIRGFTSFSEAN
ncbi:MAG: HAMP domain-containing protein, partial [Myxococcaceae bacterium]